MRAAMLSSVERFLDSALEETGGVVVFGSAFDNSYRYLKALVEYNKWECTEGVNYIAAESRRNKIEIFIDQEGNYTCKYSVVPGGTKYTTDFKKKEPVKLRTWLKQKLGPVP